MAEIRHAVVPDAAAINKICNHYIQNTPVNFKTGQLTLEEQGNWIRSFSDSGRYQLFAACEGSELIAYAGSSMFHERCAYGTSVATTVYLHPDVRAKGIGTQLYTKLFDALSKEDLHRAYAGITLPNPASEALHLKFGFKKAGLFTQAGRKSGKFWDVLWMEKALPETI
ncbi:MAG: GNAT family N-acetyltransferase [Verrucomicrobia bacterium]|nr:GNAT family N-acetyltransferase [Verrucomicrobiota bacterium]